MSEIKEISAKYLFDEARKRLSEYDKKEKESILYILFEDLFSIPKIAVLAEKYIPWGSNLQELFDSAINRLNSHEPIQYITGFTIFYNLRFNVSNAVLIPRPETEELVDLILKSIKGSDFKILDIGTGSGCIAVSLAVNLPTASVIAIDISKEALKVAQKNAAEHSVKIHFSETDFLNESENIQGQFDIIVSNPPYVMHSEKEQMQKNVLDHEPHLALFVEDQNALIYYEALLQFASIRLVPHGSFYAEINEQKGNELILLARKHGFINSIIIKDLYKKDRILLCKR